MRPRTVPRQRVAQIVAAIGCLLDLPFSYQTRQRVKLEIEDVRADEFMNDPRG